MDSYLINFKSSQFTCPECSGRLLEDDIKSELICEDCGLIYTKEELYWIENQ